MGLEQKISEILAVTYYADELKLRDITPRTLAKRKQQIARFIAWLGDRPLSAQMGKLFLAELTQTPYARNTIWSYYSALRPFFAWHNIVFKVKLKKSKRLPHYHSKDELDRIIRQVNKRSDTHANIKNRDILIIKTLAFTGLRASELVSTRSRDIRDGYLFVNRGKGEKDRVVPLTIKLARAIAQYIKQTHLAPSDLLFPITPKTLYHLVKYYAVRAGLLDVTPHSLRHYFATTLVEKGAELRKVQELLGHENIGTTAIYLDVAPRHLRETIELLEDE